MRENQPVLDPETLRRMCDQIGAPAIERIVALFKTDVTQRLARMPGLAPGQAAREAHAIKGSARSIGAMALGAAAAALEQDAPSLPQAALVDRVAALAAAFSAVCTLLDKPDFLPSNP